MKFVKPKLSIFTFSCLFCTFFFPALFFGQDYRLIEKYDSLLPLLQHRNGKEKVDLLNEVTNIKLRKNEYLKAEAFNKQALELSRALQYYDGEIQALYLNSRLLASTSADIQLMKENYYNIKKLVTHVNQKNEALLKAEVGLTLGLRQIYDMKSSKVHFDTATFYFNNIDRNSPKNYSIIRDYYTEGQVVSGKGNEYSRASLAISYKMGTYNFGLALNNYANALLVDKKYDSAFYYIDSSIIYNKRIGNIKIYNISLTTKGEIYAAINKPQQAIEYMLKGITYYDSIKSNSDRLFYYSMLAQQYEKVNDLPKSLEFLKKYIGLNDTIYDSDKMEQIKQLENNFSVNQKQQQLEISEANLQKQKQLSYFLLAGVALIIVIVVILIFFIRKQVKVNRLLDQQKAEIQSQKAELEKSKNTLSLLNSIGKKITSTNDIEAITHTVYGSINELMDASGFAICIVDKKKKILFYPCFLEKGKLIDTKLQIPLDAENKIGAICVRENRPIIINDYEKEYSKYIKKIEISSGDRPESFIYFPLTFNDEVIGALTVQSFTKNAYSDEDVELVRNLALYANIAVKNALNLQDISSQNELLENKVKERTEELEVKKQEAEKNAMNVGLLSAIGKDITSTNNLNELNRKVFEHIKKVMDTSVFGIAMLDDAEENIIFDGAIEREKELEYHTESLSDMRYSSWCFNNQKEIIVNDHFNEYKKYIADMLKPTSGDNTLSFIFYPLIFNGRSIGVLTVQSFELNQYTPDHLFFIQSISSYITIAIQNIIALTRAEHQRLQVEETNKGIVELSEIGKKITSSLDVKKISQTVYENINNLMDASVFGIGVYEPETECINMQGMIEKGRVTEDFVYELKDDNRFAVWCYKNNEVVFIGDLSSEYSKYVPTFVNAKAGENVSSLIYLPLLKDNLCIGVLTVQSFKKNAYVRSHVELLKNLSIYVVTAINNAQAYTQIEEQKQEIEAYSKGLEGKVKERTKELEEKNEMLDDTKRNLELLSEIGKKITSTLDIYKATRVIYSNVNDLMDASVLGIGIYSKQKEEIWFRGLIEKDKYLNDFSIAVNEDKLATFCFREKKEIVINDADIELSKYVSQKTALQGDKAESLIYLPLISNDEPLGVLTVQSFNKHAYNDYHLFILRNLAVYIAITIKNYSAYQQTTIAYEKLKSAQTQLVESEKMASLGQLTAGVAHEINNPINYISGGIDSLKECFNEVNEVLSIYEKADLAIDPETIMIELNKAKKLKKELDFKALNAEILTLFSSIKSGTNRTTEIVKSLRTFSRLDETSLKIANIEEGIDATTVILRSQLKDRIEVIKEYGKIPEIMCYPGQLNQVFMNIISNAAQAIESKGSIQIKTSQDDDHVTISIKDDGSGMPPEVKKRIFEPFFTTKEVGEGTGLGLSIVIGIVEKHKGTIDVITEVGKGTEFIIKISKHLS